MGKTVRGLASVAILVGSIGVMFATIRPVEAIGPSMGGTGVPHGPSMPSQKDGGGAPTPSNLRRGNSTGSSSNSSSQSSGPTTFGYWDGQSFVRKPGPWAAPDNGSKAVNQGSRGVDQGSKVVNPRPR
jgi:hypothetical protein